MDFDEILADIGEFGRYQKLVLWFIIIPAVFPCGFHAYNQLFMATTPDHWCRIPELEHLDQDLVKNISIPYEEKDGQRVFSQCLMYGKNYSNFYHQHVEEEYSAAQIPCNNGWMYDSSNYQNSVIMEWDLVCDRDISATLALVLLSAGGLVGNYIFGHIQDRLGRKPSFFIYLFIQSVFGIATAFANNFYLWCLVRIGVGFTIPAILSTPNVLGIEIVGPRYRTTVTILINIAYSLSLIFLSIIVWTIRDWRQIAFATALPFVPLFCLYRQFPESPRWLLSQGKLEEAKAILEKIARINCKPLQASHVTCLQRIVEEEDNAKDKNQKNYGVYVLFKLPNLRMKTIIITFIWFTNLSVYVGLSYYAPVLQGDEYLNFFLAGAVELPTYLFLWPSMERCGRRWILCLSMVIGGLACIVTFLVKNDSLVTLTLYCVGKMGISSSFVVLPLMASELYPTVVRGLGMSTSAVMGMLGPVFIPLVNYLGSDMLTLPLIIMGSLLVAGGACSLLLPETLNQNLPQTLEDGEKAGLVCFACYTPPQTDLEIASIHEITV